jgi:UDP-N-acetylglucosamine acyltransferase
MSARVHPTAVVDPGAQLGTDVEVGPCCVVGAAVVLGAGVHLVAHATVLGPTRIGRGCRIFPQATIGAPPQDRSYAGEPTVLEIGDDTILREQVTVHRGTLKGGGITRIGSRCLLMVGTHVAHDCVVGDDVVLTNLTTLGGHVRVEPHAVCGGLVAVAPFVRLGEGCFVAGGGMVEHDVPPYVIVAGDRARVRALNRVGLRRMRVPEDSQRALDAAFRCLWRSGQPLSCGLAEVRQRLAADPYVARLCDFLSRCLAPALPEDAASGTLRP